MSLSRDGTRLLLGTANDWWRLWSLPFDATAERTQGEGGPIDVGGSFPNTPNLSRNDRWLSYRASGIGQDELRRRDLVDGSDAVLATDVGAFAASPDGRGVAYVKRMKGTFSTRILWTETGQERSLRTLLLPSDWSPDGQWIAGSTLPPDQPACLSLAPAATGAMTLRELASDPEADLWEPHFSPDGRWLAFEAAIRSPSFSPMIRIMPATGGSWRALTPPTLYAHKPRWSPDGRRLYFLVFQNGFHNVWTLRIDPASGTAVGEPTQVTSFAGFKRSFLPEISRNGFVVGRDRLIVPVVDYSATSIWMLEQVRW
jgi:dipeptidyl aminopeptidase/acylaminoacyl peptidase